MNKFETLLENFKKNIWTTILVALTILTQVLNVAAETFDFEALNLGWVPTAITVVTFLKIIYERFILPNFTETEALDLLKYSKENRTDERLNREIFDGQTIEKSVLNSFRRSKQ